MLLNQVPPKQPVGSTIVPPWRGRSPPNAGEAARFMTAASISKQLAIEPLDADAHAERLYESFSAAGPAMYASLFTYSTGAEPNGRAAFYKWLKDIAHKPDPMFFVVLDKGKAVESTAVVGMFSLLRCDAFNGVVEIGWIKFSPRLQRTPLATETLYVTMRYVFDALGYRRYEWKCDVLNAASMRAAKRFGFTYEGVFRQAVVVKGRNRDTAWWAVVDGDYRGHLRAVYERWLDASNFDATSGAQKCALNTAVPQKISHL